MSISEINKIEMVKLLYLKNVIIIFIGLLFISLRSYSQTYALPDTSLRNKLIADYPSVMTGGLLNIPAAGAMMGALNLNNAGISNADGIQYFTKITLLNLSFNQLKNLPDISGLTQLMLLYLSYNQLQSVPALSSFPNLMDFQAAYNELTSLPSLTANTNLKYLYCQNNKLTSIPDISMLGNLQILDIGNNKFTLLPDLSPLVNLKQLHVHLTGIDTIIGLSTLSNLTILYAWGNNIRDLSELNVNTTLTIFQVFNNNLKSLPTLSNKLSLTSVDFSNNHLSFEDILPLTSIPGFTSFTYNPQKQVPLSSYTIREKDSVTFNLSIDQGISTNFYTWYKDGNILITNQTGTFSLNSAAYSDSGRYYVQVSNPGLTGLTLQSDTANLHMKPCLEINDFITEVLSEKCKEGTAIQLTSLNLSGGIAPFDYGIVKTNKTDTLFLATPQFQSLTPGVYSVIVRDSRMCKSRAAQNVSIRNPAECNVIISPNGDGIMDTYFVEEPGIIKIFDISRNLIKELSTPAEWDGRKSDGTIAEDGYYAIVVNEKKVINITVVK
jgi:internalin A